MHLSAFRDIRTFLTVLAALAVLAIPNSASAASTLKTLHAFCSVVDNNDFCRDGKNPTSQLLIDPSGNIYGAPTYGGINNDGIIFRLASPTWQKLSVLHAFCAPPSTCRFNQGYGAGALIQDVNGNFYGITYSGTNGSDFGIVFELSDEAGKWVFKDLYTFCRKAGCPDGALPSYDGLAYAGQGAGQLWNGVSPLYGTATAGGKYHKGVVFQLVPGTPHWTQAVIHDFTSGASSPNGLIADSAGHLFGSVQSGGQYGWGFLYKLVKNSDGSWTQKVMHNFCVGHPDHCAAQPMGRMVLDNSHNLFGVTYTGGATLYCPYDEGCGTVFELSSSGEYSELYDLCGQPACADGGFPDTGLVKDAAGDLFGVSKYGGITANCLNGDVGCGAVFEVIRQAETWTGVALYDFCSLTNCTDGYQPEGALTLDANGNVFGTTYAGGGHAGGSVFELLQDTPKRRAR